MSRTSVAALLLTAIALGSVTFYFWYPSSASNVGQVGEGRAALVDALSGLNPNPAFEETARRYLMEAGISFDVYTSEQVTVDFMKSFPAGYALIIFRVHSATSRHGAFYFTSEPYDDSKYQPEQLRDELRPGKDYEGHLAVFAFGSKFVNTYLRNRFHSAVVVGMGCFGAGMSYGTEEEVRIENVHLEEGPNLADAFYRQGAAAVIGWDSLVMSAFTDEATLRLIKALALERLSVRQATETVNLEMGPDPVYGSRLIFYPNQNGDETLLIQAQHTRTQAAVSNWSAIFWIGACSYQVIPFPRRSHATRLCEQPMPSIFEPTGRPPAQPL